eukprot:6173652-Pleurochrysis_carterae.AAC.4
MFKCPRGCFVVCAPYRAHGVSTHLCGAGVRDDAAHARRLGGSEPDQRVLDHNALRAVERVAHGAPPDQPSMRQRRARTYRGYTIRPQTRGFEHHSRL